MPVGASVKVSVQYSRARLFSDGVRDTSTLTAWVKERNAGLEVGITGFGAWVKVIVGTASVITRHDEEMITVEYIMIVKLISTTVQRSLTCHGALIVI